MQFHCAAYYWVIAQISSGPPHHQRLAQKTDRSELNNVRGLNAYALRFRSHFLLLFIQMRHLRMRDKS